MIENIRNYYGLMMVVLVALFLSFLFTGFSGSKAAMGGGQAYLRIDGTSYDGSAYQKQGIDARKMALNLQMYEFVGGLNGFGSRGADDNEASETFFANRILIRKAGEEYGIHPSKDEIFDYVKSMSAFAGKDGKYDPVSYRNFIERVIGRMGMTEQDLLDVASDAVIARKLGDIVGSGLGMNRQIIADSSALSRQLVSVQLAKIAIAPFKEAVKPTDEEVKAYWETIQDSFKTETKRKFAYVLAAPKLPETKPEDEKKPEDASQPEKPDPTKEDPKIIEERRNKEKELNQRMDDFFTELQNKKGAEFEELAKEQGFEVKTTELFAESQAPADLALTLRSGGRGVRAVDELFNMKVTTDPLSKISEAYAVGQNQWLLARLDGEEPSRVKTFDEAKEEAKAQVHRRKGPRGDEEERRGKTHRSP
ncbi:MAG: SurA N-terminal domain-containing protein [Luteolibacter sp.]